MLEISLAALHSFGHVLENLLYGENLYSIMLLSMPALL